jgi:hypothetical protein
VLATYVERFSGVRRTRGATNPSSNCRQKLFSDDEKVELSVWKGAPCSVLVGCNSRLIAGGCDGGGELARPKSGSPKLRKRKRGRKETIAHSLWELPSICPLYCVKTIIGVALGYVVLLQ